SLAFAVVDAPIAAAPRSPVTPLLVSVRNGKDRTRLGLYASSSVPGAYALKGKRLAFPKLGRVAVPLIENFLFGGELQLGKPTRVPTPDAASALVSARTGKADAVVLAEETYAELAGGQGDLKLLFTSGEMPLIAFCQGGANVDSSLVARARAAMTKFAASDV